LIYTIASQALELVLMFPPFPILFMGRFRKLGRRCWGFTMPRDRAQALSRIGARRLTELANDCAFTNAPDEAGLLVGIRRSEEFANHAHDVMGLAGGAVQVDFKKLGHGSDGAPA